MLSLPEHLLGVQAGREPLSREVRSEHQRDRILAAAIEVIARRGYTETTIDHIVVAARIGVGTFYDLFENKVDCFLQAYDRIVAEAVDRLAAAAPSDLSWAERMREGLAALLEAIEAEPLQARIVLIEARTAGAAGNERYEATIARLIPLLRDGRAQSSAAADLAPNLEIAVAGGLAWYLQQWIAAGGDDGEGVEPALAEVLEIVVEPYLGEESIGRLLADAPAPSAKPS